jgi:hypothetical protein
MGKISAAQGPQGVGGGLTAPAGGSRVRSCAFGTRRGDCSTFSDWCDQSEVRFCHCLPASLDSDRSNKGIFGKTPD